MQVSPFPHDLVHRELARFPAADVVWVQEEPKNMGAWSYVQPRFFTASHSQRHPRYMYILYCRNHSLKEHATTVI